MANPTLTTVTKGSWVKVATGVTNISVRFMQQDIAAWTYRLTGDPAPTLKTEKAKLVYPGMNFCSSAAFDLYIWCESEDIPFRLDVDFQAEYLIDA